MAGLRLTAAEAVVRFLAAQRPRSTAAPCRCSAACSAIFGHGNVAGLGPALHGVRGKLPTLRAPQRAGDGACRDRLRQDACAGGG